MRSTSLVLCVTSVQSWTRAVAASRPSTGWSGSGTFSRPHSPGVYDFDWLSGPRGYGFMSARSDHRPMSQAEVEEAIRGFLAQIDPVTGYIE